MNPTISASICAHLRLTSLGTFATLATFCSTLAFAGDATPSEPVVVELPPMLVSVELKPKPWLYAELPGVVVLSRTSESTMLEFMRGEFRAMQLLKFVLPESLRAQFDMPRLMILSTQEQTATAQQTLLKDGGTAQGPTGADVRRALSVAEQRVLESGPSGKGNIIVRLRSNPISVDALRESIRFLSNLRLDDLDSTATFVMMDELSFEGDRLKPSPAAIKVLVDRRTPGLPPWLKAGLDNLYRSAAFNAADVTIGPLLWVSEDERRAIVGDKYYPRILFTMAELFESNSPDDADKSDTAARWRAQAGLFVRWALRGGDPDRTATFWKFAERATAEGVSEALIQETYRLNYSDLRDTLSDYLGTTASTDGWKFSGRLERPPTIRVREATPQQIARLRGEWERLEVSYVKRLHPDFLDTYTNQAETTLATAYLAGDRDPQFLATYGIFLSETRRTAEALPILEEAAKAPNTRGRALFELARIRFEDAMAKPAGTAGKLSAAQAAEALQPLNRAHQGKPAMVELYNLAATILARSESKPTADQLALLDEGIHLFPANQGLKAIRKSLAP